ncbi:hypothetical protein JCM8097_003702 [Rhodosporidiobolus ruineniae]
MLILSLSTGYNTEWALPVIKQWLPRKHERLPKIRLMFVWFGANDSTLPHSPQSLTLARFKENLHTIVSLLRSPSSPYSSPSTKIVLITPPPVDGNKRAADLLARDPPRQPDRDVARTREFARAVEEVAKEVGSPSVDVWTAIDEAAKEDGGKLDRFLSDGLHLTPAGYRVVTDAIIATIERDLPELHWDKLEQTFPHWLHWIPAASRF